MIDPIYPVKNTFNVKIFIVVNSNINGTVVTRTNDRERNIERNIERNGGMEWQKERQLDRQTERHIEIELGTDTEWDNNREKETLTEKSDIRNW